MTWAAWNGHLDVLNRLFDCRELDVLINMPGEVSAMWVCQHCKEIDAIINLPGEVSNNCGFLSSLVHLAFSCLLWIVF